jgi:hypothetical protein
MSDLDPRLEPWLAALRKEPAPRREALERLSAALRQEDARAGRRLLSPPAALAASVALVVATSAVWIAAGRWAGWPGPGHTIESEALAPAQFVLHADDARSVSVVGDFNDWDPEATPLVHTGGGVWTVVVRLRPGTVRYSFLVNGTEWRADPRGVTARNDFGRPTSVAFIGQVEGP